MKRAWSYHNLRVGRILGRVHLYTHDCIGAPSYLNLKLLLLFFWDNIYKLMIFPQLRLIFRCENINNWCKKLYQLLIFLHHYTNGTEISIWGVEIAPLYIYIYMNNYVEVSAWCTFPSHTKTISWSSSPWNGERKKMRSLYLDSAHKVEHKRKAIILGSHRKSGHSYLFFHAKSSVE